MCVVKALKQCLNSQKLTEKHDLFCIYQIPYLLLCHAIFKRCLLNDGNVFVADGVLRAKIGNRYQPL